jgi:hypothetical protein
MNHQRMSLRRPRGGLRSGLPWVAWGLVIQALGAGAIAIVLWRGIRLESIAGHITAEIIRLAWRTELHTHLGLGVLVAGSLVYAGGSVVMARPYVSGPVTLFVAVPIAAVAGLLVFGVLALVAAALVAVLTATQGDLDLGFGDWLVRRRRRR